MSDENQSDQTANLSDAQLDSQLQSLESKVAGHKTDADVARIEARLNKGPNEEQRRDEMGKVFDALQAQQTEKDYSNKIPPPAGKVTLEDSFRRTSEWMDKTADQRQTDSEAANDIQRIKARALALGVELSDEAAVATALQLENQKAQAEAQAVPSELAPAMEQVKALYGDQIPFHQAAQRYAELDRYVRQDPVGGLAHIAEQAGMNPLQLAQQLAFRYGNQAVVQANAERIVEDWFQNAPGAEAFQDEMIKAIEGGKIKRTGHMATDLQNALAYVQNSQKRAAKAKASRPKNFESDMEDTYNRIAARARR